VGVWKFKGNGRTRETETVFEYRSICSEAGREGERMGGKGELLLEFCLPSSFPQKNLDRFLRFHTSDDRRAKLNGG
jgi:hypothetical protein